MKSSQSSLTFILFIFILRQSSCYWQQLYEEFNSQVIHLANTQWNCNSISTQIPQIYSCSQGMDYIKVDHDCNLLKYQISNILPHFQIYLYADIYGYASIDSEEYCKIDIDTTTHNVLNNIQRPDQLKQIGFSKQCPYQNTNFNYQYRETTVFEQQHDMNLMTLSITNNLDSQFQDESYLLRNLQIFINRCYKTCKKCNGQFQNNCTECYTSSIPSYGICDTCQASTTGRFLDIPAGCVFECPTGYSFDEDYVCFANNKLIEYTMCTIPSTNPSNNYQCTMNSLLPSTLHLRYRFTLNFISPLTQKISIKQNDYSISVLESSANIQSEQGTIAVLFQMGNNQYHIEINSPLIAQDQIFSISSDSQEFIVTNFNVEQKTCARFCDICLNEEECKSCQVGKFLFGGSCVDVCPPYTINQNQNCFYSMLEQNSEHTKLLVKEFYDLSTTQQRITELFEIKSGQVDSINFKKGANIFFSYLPDKRILGGPFVWVNAQIQFKLKLSSRRQIINVRFEVLLGDTVLNVQKLEYSINENQVETITLSQNLEIMPNFKDDTWDNNQQTYKQQVDQLVYFDEQYGNQLQIDFFCYGQNSKSFCGIQNLFVATQYECTKYYYFDQYNYITNQNPCIPICGDSVIIGDEECDDGNSIPFDGCFNCKYQCIELCIKCINGQCFDYIIQSKEDTIPTKYQQDFLFLEINRLENLCLFCDVCNYDQCLKCSPGFQLNLVNNQCVMFCHTQSIQELEQCDDIGNICMNKNCLLLNENNIQQDNINQLNTLDNIKTYCSLDCEVCLNGECLQCINGYFLNYVNRSCEAQCGDLIVSGFEECDDGNTDNYDGCVNCKLINYQHCNQENQQCEVCHYGYCIKCKEGVFLDNHSCFSFCGDGLLNNLEEECDNLLGIGCIDCKVQDGYVCNELNYSICNTCVEECILCEVENQKELKCQACIDGYYPVDSDCLPCNLNCITCKEDAFICTSCYRDDCELCETVSGLQTNFDLKICTATCGDGIKAIDYEYCDDGNLEDGDGCDSECKLEQSDLIINQLQDWDYQGNSSYNLGLKSNPYNFKLDCNTSLVTIDQFNQDEFQYNASVAENNTCRFQFFFIKSIFSYNIIHVSFKLIQSTQKKLLQEDNQRVKFNINPKEQIYLSDDEKSQAQSIQSAQSTFGYIFLILIPISIITNLFDYLWTVLEILSWINNFYFLNVNYPFNVEVFFLNSDWSSIISFPTYQELNQPGCDYYFTAPPRFQNKGIDPLFFNNAQVPFMFILSAIVLYFVNYIILITFSFLDSIMNPNKIVKKKRLIIFHVSTISNENQQEFVQPAQQPKEYKCLKKFVQLLNQISKEFKNKIKQTISLCLLDIMLAILLQINYADNLSNYIVFFNYLLAYFSITLIIHQVYQSFLTLNIHNVLAENEFYKDKYEIYYDKINTELSIGFYFKFIGLLRKLFYTYFMVHYYYEPFIQTLLCFISSSLGLVILAYQNPFKTKGQFYITILSDFCLSSIIFIIMIFGIHDRLNIKFVEKNKVILGWIIISLVFLAIAVEICILLYELFLYFYNNLLSIKNLFRKCLNLKIETKEMKQSKVDNHMQVPQNKISHQKDTFKKSSIPFETLQI